MATDRIEVGVISDTHGLVRPEAIAALRGSDLIVHAGDVGKPEVLEELRKIAPTIAVRGNNDKGPWVDSLPLTKVVEVGPHFFYVLHELSDLDLDPVAAEFAVVITGHSHEPSAEKRDGDPYCHGTASGPGPDQGDDLAALEEARRARTSHPEGSSKAFQRVL